MNAAEQLLQQIGETQVAGFLLVLARVSPLFLLAPLFSARTVPPRARAIVALALTFGIAPVAMRGQKVPMEVLELGGLMVKEVVVGLAFAFALAALFAGLSAAGTLIDTFSGFAYGSLIDPTTGNQGTVMVQLYAMMGVAVFVAIGGDAWVIQGLARTYDLVPLLQAPELGSLVGGTLTAFKTVFRSAIEVSAPVLLALILTDAAFGLITRVVPQLNVFAVGFTAKICVVLVLVGVTLPFTADWLGDELERSVTAALKTLKVS